MRLYLDMDGVLMNFEGAIHEHGVERYKDGANWISRPRHEWPPEMIAADKAYVEVMAIPTFWPSLKPMADGHALWTFARPLHPFVLTAAPSDRPGDTTFSAIFGRIAGQKKVSIWEHFDPTFDAEDVIVCLRHEKAQFARCLASGEPNVLVDDTPGNCKEWTEAGGIAILHTDADSTIAKLREIFHA